MLSLILTNCCMASEAQGNDFLIHANPCLSASNNLSNRSCHTQDFVEETAQNWPLSVRSFPILCGLWDAHHMINQTPTLCSLSVMSTLERTGEATCLRRTIRSRIFIEVVPCRLWIMI